MKTLHAIARHAISTTTIMRRDELHDDLEFWLNEAGCPELVDELKKARRYGVSLEEIEEMEKYFAEETKP